MKTILRSPCAWLLLLGLSLLAFSPAACASTAVTVTGKQITISVTVGTGTPPFTYQWMKDGQPLTAGTASSYVIAKAALADAGVYNVTVSNPAGSTLSDNATISFIVAPGGIVTGIQVVLRGVATVYPVG